jgi:hypothetical protein
VDRPQGCTGGGHCERPQIKIGQLVNYLSRERASGIYQITQLLPVSWAPDRWPAQKLRLPRVPTDFSKFRVNPQAPGYDANGPCESDFLQSARSADYEREDGGLFLSRVAEWVAGKARYEALVIPNLHIGTACRRVYCPDDSFFIIGAFRHFDV